MLRRLFNTSVFISLSRALTTGTNLAVMLFVSLSLGTEALGAYGICFALMYLVYTLTSFNLELFLGKEAAVGRENLGQMRELFGSALLAMGAGLAITVPAWAIAQWIYGDLAAGMLALAAACGLLLGLDMNLNGFLLGLERTGVETAVNFGASLVLLIPLALWPRHIDLVGVFALRAVGLFLGIAAKTLVLRLYWRRSLTLPRLRWFRQIRYYWFDHVAGYFLRQADILLLSFFVDLKELGVYFLALRIYLAVGILAEVGARTLVPFFSRAYHGMETLPMGRLLRRMLTLFLACGILLGAGLAFSGGWLISLFRPALASGAVWLRWLAVAVPLRMGKFILGAFMGASRYQKQHFLVHLANAGVLVVLTLILGIMHRTPGVLAARLISEFWGFFLAVWVVFFRLPDSRALKHH